MPKEYFMTMDLYLNNALRLSKTTTKAYSTSFSLGVRMLHKNIRPHIYSIYGFVRFADEIVDSFPVPAEVRSTLLSAFREETFIALREGISTNPIIHSFQYTVNKYAISPRLITAFLDSMAMDLTETTHDQASFERYIFGSASAVGLMCLAVFMNGDTAEYERLEPHAIKLGEAFQKINFLRDIKADYSFRKRSYFPDIKPESFTSKQKSKLEKEIFEDFRIAREGIIQLPRCCRFGVYVAYNYYRTLTRKIQHCKAEDLLNRRIRVNNFRKLVVLKMAFLHHLFRTYP